MPDETVWRTMLFDFYGELLTEKQREYYDLHYTQDLFPFPCLFLLLLVPPLPSAASALYYTLTKLRDCVGGDARPLAEQALRQLQDLKG